MTDSLLSDTGYVFLLTSPDLDEADAGCSDYVNDLYDYCVDHGYAFYALTPPDSAAQSRWTDVIRHILRINNMKEVHNEKNNIRNN